MIKNKINKPGNGLLISGFIGTFLAIAIAMGLTVLFAVFINNEYIDIKQSGVLSLIVVFMATFLGAFVSGKIFNAPPYYGLIVSGIVLLLTFCVALLFFGGLKVQAIWGILCCLLSGGLNYIICKQGRKPHKSRHFKRNHR